MSIQFLNKTAVLDFFQDCRIDEVARVKAFHLLAGFGELIDDGLNAFAVGVRNPADTAL